jgi:hypothetical protein
MNYLLGYVKIPKDLTVTQFKVALSKLSKEYNVRVGVEYIKEINPTFYELKLKADKYPGKLDRLKSERINLVIDNQLNIYTNKRLFQYR